MTAKAIISLDFKELVIFETKEDFVDFCQKYHGVYAAFIEWTGAGVYGWDSDYTYRKLSSEEKAQVLKIFADFLK